jgi:hypothetical protein
VRHSYDYPLAVDYSAANYVDDQNFALDGTVDMTRTLADAVRTGRAWHRVAHSTETLQSYGILARANGVTSQSDGHSTSSFRGLDDRGRPYVHHLASEHGVVTRDVVRRG